jgi:hypothetical protein
MSFGGVGVNAAGLVDQQAFGCRNPDRRSVQSDFYSFLPVNTSACVAPPNSILD